MVNRVVESTAQKSNNKGKSISHSIINSLNVFNTISKEETDKVNNLLLSTEQWLSNISNKVKNTENKQVILSPEKTEPTMKIIKEEVPILSSPHKVDFNLPEADTISIHDSETTGKQDLFITANPSPIALKTPKSKNDITNPIIHINQNTQKDNGSPSYKTDDITSNKESTNTPISQQNDITASPLNVEKNINKINNTNDKSISTNSSSFSNKRKQSPWSPFKVDTALKNYNIGEGKDRNDSEKIDKPVIIPETNQSVKLPDPTVTMSDKLTDLSKNNSSLLKPVIPNNSDKNVTSNTTLKDKKEDIVKFSSPSVPSRNKSTIAISIKNTQPSGKTSSTISHDTNRLKMRANMFAPLPEKDPLIVRNQSPRATRSVSNSNLQTMKYQTLNSTLKSSTSNLVNLSRNKPISLNRISSPSKLHKTKPPIPSRNRLDTKITPHGKTAQSSRISPQINRNLASPLRRQNESHIVKKDHTKNNKSPLSKLPSGTPSRNNTSALKTGGVFDRLASLPTKSFEQKKHLKNGSTPISRKHNPSSIDVTGSPIKRVSPKLKQANHTDISMQETLKSIFSTTKSQNSRSPTAQVKRNLSNKNTIPQNDSNKVFDSLIPSLTPKNDSKEERTGPPHISPSSKSNGSITKTESLTKVSTTTQGTNTLVDFNTLSPSKKPQPIFTSSLAKLQKVSVVPPTTEKISPTTAGNKPTSFIMDEGSMAKLNKDVSFTDDTEKEKNPSIKEKEVSNISLNNITEERHTQERVSNIQFIPATERSKDDVKTKLNKRLSEVLRTQQEQEKKRKENQQKRKRSQMEDELKRRNSRYSNYKMYSKKRSMGTSTDYNAKNVVRTQTNNTGVKNQIANVQNQNDAVFNTQNILGDIDKVDYRNIIGGENVPSVDSLSNINQIGDDSLPEIPSDNEQDEVIMAEWASGSTLENQLKIQQNWDPKRIFGPVAPLHIDEIFPASSNSRLNKVKSRLSKKSSWKN